MIPKKIGYMKSLDSIDLSRNQLSGKIPSSMSNLNFLASQKPLHERTKPQLLKTSPPPPSHLHLLHLLHRSLSTNYYPKPLPSSPPSPVTNTNS
ncbi:hypothetical protein ACSBR2_037037 [Camellia fascicularis]